MVSLYNSDMVLNDLLREAHPEGSVKVIDTPSKEGVVEDSVDSQLKALRVIYKQPVAKVLAGLAEKLEKFGAQELSESVDAIAYDFYHESLFIKEANVGDSQKVINVATFVINVLKAYQKNQGADLIKFLSESRGNGTVGEWAKVVNYISEWLKSIDTVIEDINDDIITRFKNHNEDNNKSSVLVMHFAQSFHGATREFTSDAQEISTFLSNFQDSESHIKAIQVLINFIENIKTNVINYADKHPELIGGAGQQSPKNVTAPIARHYPIKSKKAPDDVAHTHEQTKVPGLGPKKEEEAKAIYSITFDFEGKKVNRFPLAYILKNFQPAVYFEIMKHYGVVPVTMTLQDAAKPDASGTSLVHRFTERLNDEIVSQFGPRYQLITEYFTNLDARIAAGEGDAKVPGAEAARDMMDVVAEQHPEAMALVTKNSSAWNAIKGVLLRDQNHNNILADANGMSNLHQQHNIAGRAQLIRSVIINILRQQGIIR